MSRSAISPRSPRIKSFTKGPQTVVSFSLDEAGKIIAFSPSARTYFSLTKSLGRRFDEIFRADIKEADLASFPPKKDIVEGAVRFIGREGRNDKGEIQIVRLRDKQKEISGYMVTAHIKDVEYDGFEGLPEGFLLKKASLSANKWQKRYFRARKVVWTDKPAEYVLDYFADHQTVNAKGSIKLQGSIIATNFQQLVFTICDPRDKSRDVFLKAPAPLIRWQWSRALHKLALYGVDITPEAMEEMRRAKKVGQELSGLLLANTNEPKRTSWREAAGRHGGKDGFQMSDIARIAMRRMQTSNEGLSAKIPNNVFEQDFDFNSKFLNVQVISARGLQVRSSSKIVMRVSLVGPRRLRDEVGESEIGFGPDPVFGGYEPRLCKDRKTHNILAHVPLPTGVSVNDCVLIIKAFELRTLGDSLLGESRLSLAKLPTNKIISAWHRLKPLDKRRGDIKMTFYYEHERKRRKVLRQMSSFSSIDEFDDDDDDGNGNRNGGVDANGFVHDPFKEVGADDPFHDDNDQKIQFPADTRSEELEAARREIEALKASLSASQSASAAAALNRQKWEDDVRVGLKRRLDAFNAEKKKSDAMVKEHKDKSDKLQKQILLLNADKKKLVEAKRKVDADLKRRLTGAKKLYDRELAGRKKAESSLEKLRAQVASAGKERDSAANSAVVALQEEVKELQAQLLQAKEERDLAEKAASAAEHRASQEREAAGKLGVDLKARDDTILQLQEGLKEKEDRIAELNTTVATLKDAIAALEDRVQDAQRSAKQKQLEIEELKAKFAAESARAATAESHAARAQAETKRVKDELGEALKRMEEAEAEAISATERAREVESQLEAAAAAAEEAERARKAEAEAAAIAAKANASIPRHLRVQLAMYARYFNAVLGDSTELTARGVIPLAEEERAWAGRRGIASRLGGDGQLVAAYLNYCIPNAIDNRAMHVPGKAGPLTKEQQRENLSLVASTCKSVGVAVGRVAELVDLLSDPVSRPVNAAEFLFALVSFHVLGEVRLERCPELKAEADDAKMERMASYPAELLDEWVPFHISSYAAKASKANTAPSSVPLSDEIQLSSPWGDLKVPSLLVSAVVERAGPLVSVRGGLKALELGRDFVQQEAVGERHVRMVEQLELLGARYAASFLIPSHQLQKDGEDDKKQQADVSIAWRRANLLFSACLMDASSELVLSNSAEMSESGVKGNTEMAAMKVWLNNLGLNNVNRIHDLFAAVKDGLLLLKVLDFMSPGCVNWKKAELKPNHKIKRISNCSLAVDIAKKPGFFFSLVGVGGSDIYEGNRKLTMSLLWQMRRWQLLHFLKTIFQKSGREGSSTRSSSSSSSKRRGSTSLSAFDENIVMDWANSTVEAAIKDRGYPDGSQRLFSEKKKQKGMCSISSMKDDSLSTSVFYLLLLWAKRPFSVNWRFVTPGSNADQKSLNAKYAITVARKIGVSVFVLPEDLVKLRPKMVLVFLGALLGIDSTPAEDRASTDAE